MCLKQCSWMDFVQLVTSSRKPAPFCVFLWACLHRAKLFTLRFVKNGPFQGIFEVFLELWCTKCVSNNVLGWDFVQLVTSSWKPAPFCVFLWACLKRAKLFTLRFGKNGPFRGIFEVLLQLWCTKCVSNNVLGQILCNLSPHLGNQHHFASFCGPVSKGQNFSH